MFNVHYMKGLVAAETVNITKMLVCTVNQMIIYIRMRTMYVGYMKGNGAPATVNIIEM